jgi:hypothetical protein
VLGKAPEHVRTSQKRKFLGALPDDKTKARVTLRAAPAVNPPAAVDYYSKFPASSWGMLGNDSVGDCVAAGAFHGADVFEFNGQNVTPSFTDTEALAMYSAISGYNPRNPNSDVGATLQSGLDYWRKTGVAGYTLAAFAQFDYTNTSLLKQVISDFGVAYLALEVPKSAMDQFDAGQPWTVVSRSPIEGGHCVPAAGYDANYLYIITWGAVQKVAWSFYSKFFEESWVPISADWLTRSGTTPSGYDSAAANAEYQKLTGTTDSPFPAVSPTPTPTPDPTPVPSDVDDQLAAAAQAWLTAHNYTHQHGH